MCFCAGGCSERPQVRGAGGRAGPRPTPAVLHRGGPKWWCKMRTEIGPKCRRNNFGPYMFVFHDTLAKLHAGRNWTEIFVHRTEFFSATEWPYCSELISVQTGSRFGPPLSAGGRPGRAGSAGGLAGRRATGGLGGGGAWRAGAAGGVGWSGARGRWGWTVSVAGRGREGGPVGAFAAVG